jgi:hypothetical protein
VELRRWTLMRLAWPAIFVPRAEELIDGFGRSGSDSSRIFVSFVACCVAEPPVAIICGRWLEITEDHDP